MFVHVDGCLFNLIVVCLLFDVCCLSFVVWLLIAILIVCYEQSCLTTLYVVGLFVVFWFRLFVFVGMSLMLLLVAVCRLLL